MTIKPLHGLWSCVISYHFNQHLWLTASSFLDDKTNFDSFHFSTQNVIFSKLPPSPALHSIWANAPDSNASKYYRTGAMKRKPIRLRSNRAVEDGKEKSSLIKTYNSVQIDLGVTTLHPPQGLLWVHQSYRRDCLEGESSGPWMARRVPSARRPAVPSWRRYSRPRCGRKREVSRRHSSSNAAASPREGKENRLG